MSFLAKIEIDGALHNVLDCTFRFHQPVSENNKPDGSVKGGQIDVTIELSQHLDLLDWMVQPLMTKDGQVIFYKRDALSKQIALQFKEAFCTQLTGNYDGVSEEPLKVSFTISAKELRINESVEYLNIWN